MEWVAVGIVVVAIVVAVAMANKPRKGIQRNMKRMSRTMNPVKNDLNTIKEEKKQLTNIQKEIQNDFQYKSATLKATKQTLKQAPAWYKELWKSKPDKQFPQV